MVATGVALLGVGVAGLAHAAVRGRPKEVMYR
jgi:hypothetical protein